MRVGLGRGGTGIFLCILLVRGGGCWSLWGAGGVVRVGCRGGLLVVVRVRGWGWRGVCLGWFGWVGGGVGLVGGGVGGRGVLGAGGGEFYCGEYVAGGCLREGLMRGEDVVMAVAGGVVVACEAKVAEGLGALGLGVR